MTPVRALQNSADVFVTPVRALQNSADVFVTPVRALQNSADVFGTPVRALHNSTDVFVTPVRLFLWSSFIAVSSVCRFDCKWPLVHLFNFCGQSLSRRHYLVMCQPVERIFIDRFIYESQSQG